MGCGSGAHRGVEVDPWGCGSGSMGCVSGSIGVWKWIHKGVEVDPWVWKWGP